MEDKINNLKATRNLWNALVRVEIYVVRFLFSFSFFFFFFYLFLQSFRETSPSRCNEDNTVRNKQLNLSESDNRELSGSGARLFYAI